MAFDISRLTQLCTRLATIDLFGTVTKVRPNLNAATAINAAGTNGSAQMPLADRSTYSTAVRNELPDLLLKLKNESPALRVSIIERFYAPVYEHAKLPGVLDVRPELRRFL